MEIVAIFHQYILNICKSQLTLKKLPPLKPILVFTTWGQKCIVSVLQLFEMENFDLGHPEIALDKGDLPPISNRFGFAPFTIRISTMSNLSSLIDKHSGLQPR